MNAPFDPCGFYDLPALPKKRILIPYKNLVKAMGDYTNHVKRLVFKDKSAILHVVVDNEKYLLGSAFTAQEQQEEQLMFQKVMIEYFQKVSQRLIPILLGSSSDQQAIKELFKELDDLYNLENITDFNPRHRRAVIGKRETKKRMTRKSVALNAAHPLIKWQLDKKN